MSTATWTGWSARTAANSSLQSDLCLVTRRRSTAAQWRFSPALTVAKISQGKQIWRWGLVWCDESRVIIFKIFSGPQRFITFREKVSLLILWPNIYQQKLDESTHKEDTHRTRHWPLNTRLLSISNAIMRQIRRFSSSYYPLLIYLGPQQILFWK